MTTKCAIWARVSSAEQSTAGQLAELRSWAERRGLDVSAEYVTEDSAWTKGGNGAKGAEFDAKRRELLNGARLGNYSIVLIWSLDRLSRRGTEDTLATLRRLTEYEADVWSHQEDWLRTSGPEMRELLVGIFAWLARQESERRSARVKLAMARPDVQAKLANRKPRGKDKRQGQRSCEGYKQAWTEERRAALAERNSQRAEAKTEEAQ